MEVNKELGTVMLMPISNPYINTNYGDESNCSTLI